jgi:hypothetical protein
MLYPPDHPGFERALQLAFDGCSQLLALFPSCTLQLGSAGLSFMGQPLPRDGSLDRVVERLRARKIPAVTFLEGTSKQELLELFRVLGTAPDVVEAQGGAELWLRRAGVERILLDAPSGPPSYQASWESFLSAQEAADRTALEKLLSLCPEPCRAAPEVSAIGPDSEEMLAWLTEVLSATAATFSQGSPNRELWLRQVVLPVRGLTPALRGRLFRLYPCHDTDVLREVASLLEPEEAAELVVDYPSAVVGEASEQLEAVLQRVLPDRERADQVEPLVKAALLSRGMTEESYQNVVSLVLRRNLSAATPALSLGETRGEVRRPSLLADIISSVSARALRENQLEMLLELTSSPGVGDAREGLLTQLVELLSYSLSDSTDDRAADLLRRVEEAIVLEALSPEEKRLLRVCVTQAFSPDLCRRMARYVLREPYEQNLVVLRAMSRAEGGFDALLQIAAETSLPWLHGAAGSAILRMGERSAEGCYQTLTSGASKEAIGLAHALALSGAREGLERVLWALEHPDSAVVAGLMEALAHSRDETAELVLLDALQTGCPEVQNAAALSLGRHPSGRAVAALSSLLTGPFGLRRINLARSAVRALAQIGRVECLPPLRALLKRRSLFRRHQAGELRVLAGEALAAIPHPDAEEILREEAASRESELSGICTRALELRQSMLAAEVGDAAPR